MASSVALTGFSQPPGWSVLGALRDHWPQAEGLECFPELQVLLFRGLSASRDKVPPGLPARSPWQGLFSTLPPLSNTAFQGIPLSCSLHPSLCLSRDQVLRVLAKNEKQISLLRDLEGLKPQKVRTPQGLGTHSSSLHSGLRIWLSPSCSPHPKPAL